MIFFKIFAILITAGAGLLQIGLEYKWHDKSTKKHKIVRSLLIFLIIIGMLSTVILVLNDDRQSDFQIRTLTDLKESAKKSEVKELKAVEERERIKQELEKLQVQMMPVIKLATEKYPSLDIDTALKKLSDDIQKLETQTVDLKLKVAPRHLTVNQRVAIKSVLSLIPEKLKAIYV